jgi:hypothetical protein
MINSAAIQHFNANFAIKLLGFLTLAITPVLYIISITILSMTFSENTALNPSIVLFARIMHVAFHGLRSALSVIFLTLAIQLETREPLWFINMALSCITIAYNVASILFTFELICPAHVLFVEWFSIVVLVLFIGTVGICVEEALDSSFGVDQVEQSRQRVRAGTFNLFRIRCCRLKILMLPKSLEIQLVHQLPN